MLAATSAGQSQQLACHRHPAYNNGCIAGERARKKIPRDRETDVAGAEGRLEMTSQRHLTAGQTILRDVNVCGVAGTSNCAQERGQRRPVPRMR